MCIRVWFRDGQGFLSFKRLQDNRSILVRSSQRFVAFSQPQIESGDFYSCSNMLKMKTHSKGFVTLYIYAE